MVVYFFGCLYSYLGNWIAFAKYHIYSLVVGIVFLLRVCGIYRARFLAVFIYREGAVWIGRSLGIVVGNIPKALVFKVSNNLDIS